MILYHTETYCFKTAGGMIVYFNEKNEIKRINEIEGKNERNGLHPADTKGLVGLFNNNNINTNNNYQISRVTLSNKNDKKNITNIFSVYFQIF